MNISSRVSVCHEMACEQYVTGHYRGRGIDCGDLCRDDERENMTEILFEWEDRL